MALQTFERHVNAPRRRRWCSGGDPLLIGCQWHHRCTYVVMKVVSNDGASHRGARRGQTPPTRYGRDLTVQEQAHFILTSSPIGPRRRQSSCVTRVGWQTSFNILSVVVVVVGGKESKQGKSATKNAAAPQHRDGLNGDRAVSKRSAWIRLLCTAIQTHRWAQRCREILSFEQKQRGFKKLCLKNAQCSETLSHFIF